MPVEGQGGKTWLQRKREKYDGGRQRIGAGRGREGKMRKWKEGVKELE